ncbi:MAG TPA: energy-coupling factor transporter ATPase [Erysipelotrichaceae bacterium]|nr:energy-coupling factor transporter ATPase [Erysipelotrichaceae bacterium]
MKHVEIKNLNFSYQENVPVVKDVSLYIEKGSYTTLVGHNGSGKSTIAKLIVGLLEKDSGEIYVDGLAMNEDNIRKIRKKIGTVFQNPDNQFIGSTVRDDIAFGLENAQVNQSEMDAIINRFAQDVGMMEYLDREPENLSGGQKQRVAIAGVLAMSPDIIVFDEATSMLDPRGKREIKQLIKDIHKVNQITVISITHDIEEVVASDYVYVLNDGKVAMAGKPEDVLVQKDKLINLSLDVPFAIKIQQLFKDVNINLKSEIKMEGLVSEICQLKSKI